MASIKLFSCFLLALTTVSAHLGQRRIFGGSDAVTGQFIYQVSLRQFDRGNYDHFCGGSILNENTILTAGHCFYETGIRIEDVAAFVGSNRLSGDSAVYQIEEAFVHPRYASAETNLGFDVALLRTQISIKFNPQRVGPIALPQSDLPRGGGVTAVLSGWGITRSGKDVSPPDALQFLKSQTIQRSECIIRLYAAGQSVDNGTVCTLEKRGHGGCFGDSGSPLVSIETNEVIGIVHGGTVCGQGVPCIYTKVYRYLSWIKSHMG